MAEIQPNLICFFLVCRKRLWRAPMPVWLWWWNPANTAWVTSRLWRPCVRARLNWCSSPATPLLWGEKVDVILVDFDCNEKILQRSRFPLRSSMFICCVVGGTIWSLAKTKLTEKYDFNQYVCWWKLWSSILRNNVQRHQCYSKRSHFISDCCALRSTQFSSA